MVWSGLTKYLWQMVNIRGKTVEISGFGVIGPVFDEWSALTNPLNKGPLQD